MPNEKTMVIGKDKTLPIRKETMKKILSKVGLGAAGIAGGVGISSFFMSMSKDDSQPEASNNIPHKPDVHAEPVHATSVTDNMSFNEAFSTARHEAGATGYFTWHGKVFNTMYREEQALLSPQEQKEVYANIMEHQKEHIADNDLHHDKPVVIVHEEAPQATHVHDDLSFKDAFAIAREEVGPGGTFEWKGNLYNTYTREEYDAMTDEQKQEYTASIDHATTVPHDVSAKDIEIVSIDGGDTTVHTNHGETDNVAVEGEQMLQEQWMDDGTGHKIRVAEFLINGEHIVKIDQDGDGNYDMTMTQNEDGTVHVQTPDGQEADLSGEDFAQLQHLDSSDVHTDFSANDNIDFTAHDDHHNTHVNDDVTSYYNHNNMSLNNDFPDLNDNIV
ncbi:MAG: hypothetical protein JSS64_11465 [Bacteroidetes bacterium]|nr:hypothetical protein [Bacteroidota bacterium]